MNTARGLYAQLSEEMGFGLVNPAFDIYLPDKQYIKSIRLGKGILKNLIKSALIVSITLIFTWATFLINEKAGLALFLPYLIIISSLCTVLLKKVRYFKESSYNYTTTISKAEKYYSLIDVLKRYSAEIKEASIDDKGTLSANVGEGVKLLLNAHYSGGTKAPSWSYTYELVMNINNLFNQKIDLEKTDSLRIPLELRDFIMRLRESDWIKDAIDNYYSPAIVIERNVLSIKGELFDLQHKTDDHIKMVSYLLSTMKFLRKFKL